ncbi:MAG: TIGR00266 family protein [Gaiellales bacterium]
MDVQVRHTPSFAVVRCTMAGGEAVRAESGAMMATSDGIAVEAKMQGGLMKSLKRSVLGGESLFITTFTAPPQGGWVDCAANLPGDAIVRTVGAGKPLNLSRGAFLACESGVEIDTQWGGFKNLSGGEGGFLVHASGEGEVVAACYGALDTITLGPGEKVVVDSGHMVAYDDTVQMSTRRVAGTVASMKSGEGLVLEFTGPGEVLTQTRNPSALISWLTTALPFTRQ